MTAPVLRGYQQTLLDDAETEWQTGARAVMLQLPTGGGKTEIGIAALMRSGGTGAWITHRVELRQQSGNRLRDAGLRVTDMRDTRAAQRGWQPGGVTVVSPGLRRFPAMPAAAAAGLLVVDEAHHAPAATWQRLMRDWPGRVLGLTATPWRLTRSEGFEDLFDVLVCGPQKHELQAEQWLASELLASPAGIDRSKLKVRAGEFTDASVETAVDRLMMRDCLLSEWRAVTDAMAERHGSDDKRTIWYLPTVSSARKLAAVLRDAGETAASVEAGTPRDEREHVFAELRSGGLTHLCNVNIASEGIDIPAVGVVAVARATRSLVSWLQWTGRAGRPKGVPGVDAGCCLILDFGNNAAHLGSPSQSREWSLAARGDTGSEQDAPLARCVEAEWSETANEWTGCSAMFAPAVRLCPLCSAAQYADCGGCGVTQRRTSLTDGSCADCRRAREVAVRMRLQADLIGGGDMDDLRWLAEHGRWSRKTRGQFLTASRIAYLWSPSASDHQKWGPSLSVNERHGAAQASYQKRDGKWLNKTLASSADDLRGVKAETRMWLAALTSASDESSAEPPPAHGHAVVPRSLPLPSPQPDSSTEQSDAHGHAVVPRSLPLPSPQPDRSDALREQAQRDASDRTASAGERAAGIAATARLVAEARAADQKRGLQLWQQRNTNSKAA